MKSVWDCDYTHKGIYKKRKGWKRKWCGCIFYPKHAPCVLYHLLGVPGHGIAVFQATILAPFMAWYMELFCRKKARKRAADESASSVAQGQTEAAAGFGSKRASLLAIQGKPEMEVITLPNSPGHKAPPMITVITLTKPQ